MMEEDMYVSWDWQKKEIVDRAVRLASRLKYKDGWIFKAEGGRIFVGYEAEDVNDRTRKVTLGTCVLVEDIFTDDHFLGQIFRVIQMLEKHEASEWFKVDGKAIFNEHDFPERLFR